MKNASRGVQSFSAQNNQELEPAARQSSEYPAYPSEAPQPSRLPGNEDLTDSWGSTGTPDRSVTPGETVEELCVTWRDFLQTRSARSDARDRHVLSSRDAKLHRAAAGGDAEVCKLLLASGADLGARDASGAAALHFAAAAGHAAVCRLLLEAGAEATARDIAGDTALQRAARAGNIKVCKLLRENAARAERRAAEAPASPAERAEWGIPSARTTRVAPAARTPARPAPSLSEAKAAATELQKALAAQGFPSSCLEAEPPAARRPRPAVDTALDECECDRAGQLANRGGSPRHVFPPEVRPPKGTRCFGR